MMESTVPPAVSQTEVVDGPVAEAEPVLRLRLRKPRSDRRVVFMEGTVDNEHMNKKKSKCCCIYKKPTVFGESSSESEDECEHCYGHTEVKVKKKQDSTVTVELDAASTSATPQPTEQPQEPGDGDKGESPPGDNPGQPKD